MHLLEIKNIQKKYTTDKGTIHDLSAFIKNLFINTKKNKINILHSINPYQFIHFLQK